MTLATLRMRILLLPAVRITFKEDEEAVPDGKDQLKKSAIGGSDMVLSCAGTNL